MGKHNLIFKCDGHSGVGKLGSDPRFDDNDKDREMRTKHMTMTSQITER